MTKKFRKNFQGNYVQKKADVYLSYPATQLNKKCKPVETDISAFEDRFHRDLNSWEHRLVRCLFNDIQPKRIWCLGGYTNLDVLIGTADLNDVYIKNIDPTALADIGEKHKEILTRLKAKERNITYEFVNDFVGQESHESSFKNLKGIDYVSQDKIFKGNYDVVWMNVVDEMRKCFHRASLGSGISKDTLYIFNHYGHPDSWLGEIPGIDHYIPLVAVSRSLAFFTTNQSVIDFCDKLAVQTFPAPWNKEQDVRLMRTSGRGWNRWVEEQNNNENPGIYAQANYYNDLENRELDKSENDSGD
tara:strand:- start:1672 stop:2577 length:906 start_codon:yes stop_codon:yes gene_type:complete